MRHQIRWTLEKIQKRLGALQSLVYQHRASIPPLQYREGEGPGPLTPELLQEIGPSWKAIAPHSYWGRPRINFLIKGVFTIPEAWPEAKSTALYLPLGDAGNFSHPEALVYLDGAAYAACDRHHQEVILPEDISAGEEHQLALQGWTGIGGLTEAEMSQKLRMGQPAVVQIHQPTRDFIALARVALGVAQQLEEREPARHHLTTALDEAFKRLEMRGAPGKDFYRSIPEARKTLLGGIEQAGQPLDVDITAIGHAHIDVAWLWTLAQTRGKARRTFRNMIRLLERHPAFHFTQSQPQLYEFIRQDDPALFQEIQDLVEEGRWEPIGGMWVEADCNISGNESLARQFLLGRQFFREHFGEKAESPVLWLPDVFGYAWNLPQLIKEAGLDYFFTIKIGWNQYNRLPHDSFWWQGLDGTKVLTHFSTTKDPDSSHAATYNADASPEQIMGTWLNFQDKDYGPAGTIPPLLMSYGWGDGGGGPTREMLENIREMGDFPAAPRVQTGKVIDFFRDLEEVSEDLPVWNGELYLEYHRGTYTTQGAIKRANRKAEFALHDAEFLAAYASLWEGDYTYPHQELERAWKLVCLNQFHDILPGSSIAQVYQEALSQYQEVREITDQVREGALEVLARHIPGQTLIVNPTSFTRQEVLDIDGRPVQTDVIPPYSITPFDDVQVPKTGSALEAQPRLLENGLLRVAFNDQGDITRIYDKEAGREVLADGAVGNQFQAFEDRPLNWDAWDIDIFYDEKRWLAEPASSIEILEAGPLRATLEIKRRILDSPYTQRISLCQGSRRLDIQTEIDWRERETLLKVAFPVQVLSPTATYEVQWGNVERPTHRNTSWDWARFETAAQKWVDLSEGGYGVSLLNDCKYGHDIHENVLRLTLLRGTTAPDPQADLGVHHFSYSLYPHQGHWDENTIREAYALNDPLIITRGQDETTPSGQARKTSLLSVDQPHVVIETVKRAQDDKGIIIRLYESQRKRGPFTLRTGFPLAGAWRTNLLEENQQQLAVDQYQLQGTIRPYQILTLRLQPAG